MKPVLVGQAPGPNTDPHEPLHPYPVHKSGGRLRELIGISVESYLEGFQRVNLIHKFPGQDKGGEDKCPRRLARNTANALRPLLVGRRVILVGRNVADAFGLSTIPFYAWCTERGANFVVVPHPSGRNRMFNTPEAREEARVFWDAFKERCFAEAT